ncbi:InlB B-repeat-containing protein, partial [Candidatus Saccharibacteria bacterium]|nr:InlB B-repeat-containing protein [Candidatus Saccharibacteria bacterium]
YNKNTTDTVSSMPSNTSCTTTTGSCSITVAGTPTRTNYAFAGWNTKSDGTGTGKVAGNTISMSKNRTLYAQWVQYTHTLKYDANGGTKPSGKLGDSTITDGNTSYTFTVSSDTPTPPTGKKFIGWSTSSTATSASYTGGSTISVTGTTTLYAVYEAYTVATFSAPEITITSTELTHTSGNNYKAIGSKQIYSLTAYYHVKRENNTPSSATSYYGYRSATTADGVYPNNTTLSNALTQGITQDISVPYDTPSITNGTWHYNLCFYFKYDSKVYYDGTTRIGSAETATTYKCINIYNPGQYYASFSGAVSVSNGTGLSGDGTARTGNGYKSAFSVTPNYSITRTDGLTTPTTATSYYAINTTTSSYNANSYPGDSATKTLSNALGIAATDKTQSWSGSASAIDIDIGGAEQHRCFYLRYDSSVLYYDNDRQSGNFAGKNYACVSITNPTNTETISFTGTPVSATMTANDRLTRTDSNRVGTIINHDRNTDGSLCGSASASTDSKIGKWCDNADARTATYTADFSHQITRNDNSSTILGKTMNADVSWQVQYAYPNTTPYVNSSGVWVVSGVTWSNYTATNENAGNAVSGTTSLGASGSVTINTQPKLTANDGQILYYCQRVAYTASITYKTISVTDRNDYGVDGGTPASMTTYSNPLCVTLKNPVWREDDDGHLTHEIHVTATPHDTEFTSGQFSKTGSGADSSHETLVINPTLYINHTVTRDDTQGDDESDSIFSDKFWQQTIYESGDDHKVTTNLMGYELVVGLDSSHHLKGVTGGNSLDGALAITLGARSKTDSDSITTTRDKGASALTFNATGTSKYSVMAGQTRSFTIESSVRPTKWTFEYKKVKLTEYYTKQGTGPVTASGTTVSTFDRIEKYDSAPVASNSPAHRESSPVSFSVNRPYNFQITSVTPNNISGVGGQIAYDDDSLSVTYTINIDQENSDHAYVTDPNHTDNTRYVYPVSYILPATISSSTINSNATGIHSGAGITDICSHFAGIAKTGSCVTYTSSAHPEKLSASDSVHVPSASPQGAVVDTVFRHVYTYTGSAYPLKYTTGTITIQNPDGTPLAVGEKFCTALAIKNYSSASDAYFISPSSCRNISKRPSVQILGSSIISTGGVDTSESTYKGTRFGSWTDFAVIAGGNVKRMNSGASAIGGVATSQTFCQRSPLTIANKDCTSTTAALGNSNIVASTDFVRKLFAYFVNNTTLPSSDLVAEANRTYIIRTNDNLTLSHNIINNHPNSQVIIIAKNININSNVTQLDAWLVAASLNSAGTAVTSGTIDTCADVADDSLSASVCTNRLTVNGQLYGGKIKLKRTTGGDPAEAGGSTLAYPAEIVNYTPSTYLWGISEANKENNPR